MAKRFSVDRFGAFIAALDATSRCISAAKGHFARVPLGCEYKLDPRRSNAKGSMGTHLRAASSRRAAPLRPAEGKGVTGVEPGAPARRQSELILEEDHSGVQYRFLFQFGWVGVLPVV